MEKHIKESINNDLVKQAGNLYGVEFESIKYHGGFENFVYMFNKDSSEYVLRLVHSDHNIYKHVLAEIEFIDYLALNGACVSTVIKSENNNIVEKIMINNTDYFSVSVFTRGLGGRVREELGDPLFWEDLGNQIGLLHKLTKDFDPEHRRPKWEDDTLFKFASKFLVGDDLKILDIFNNKIDKLVALPKTKDNYGLIHTDLHIGNMVIDQNRKLTFFDFDDAAYKHFISDIAIVLFYYFLAVNASLQERSEKTVWILNNFFKGYKKNNILPKSELNYLNDFLKLRELTLYTVIKAGGPDVCNSGFGSFYIETFKDKIINNIPFIDLEYVLNNLKY